MSRPTPFVDAFVLLPLVRVAGNTLERDSRVFKYGRRSDCRTPGDECTRCLGGSAALGGFERSLAVVVAPFGVGPAREQHADEVYVAELCGEVQRRAPVGRRARGV